MRVDFEDCRFFGPCIAACLVWRSPSQRLEVFGKIAGGDEGQDMGLEALHVIGVEGLDRCVPDRPVHTPGRAVGPTGDKAWSADIYAAGDADAPDDVRPGETAARIGAVLWQVGEGHGVVGQHGVDLAGECLDHMRQEGRFAPE